jgi:hypothetical protein
MNISRWAIFTNLLFCLVPIEASQHLFYREVNLIGGYSDNDKWIGQNDPLSNSVGFEDYRKLSNDYGDYLTTDLQVRLAYDPTVSSDDAWAIQIHNAWAELKGWGSEKYLGGHFDPAYGLESVVDTHSTIFQTLAMQDIGFNKDWGVAVKGMAPAFDYEAALQLGSGMSIRREDGSYLATARAASPVGNKQFGVSVLMGRVLDSMGMSTFPRNDLVSDGSVQKKRIGADTQILFGPALVKAEASFGKNDSTQVMGYLGELNYTIPKHQTWEIECQYKSWINDLDRGGSDDSTLSLGATNKVREDITLRTAYIKDLHLMNGDEDEKILLQLYYYAQ